MTEVTAIPDRLVPMEVTIQMGQLPLRYLNLGSRMVLNDDFFKLAFFFPTLIRRKVTKKNSGIGAP